METKNLLIGGGVLVAGYFLLKNNSAAAATQTAIPGTQTVNSLLPGAATTTYPYLVSGAPALPAVFNTAYYLQYIRPAMVAANGNVNSPKYTLSQTDANNYLANYNDVHQWANTASVLKESQTGHTVLGAAQYHWHLYGVAEQRTFLPLPWVDPSNWVPPPANPKSSGGGVPWGSIISAVATVAVAVAGPETSYPVDTLNDAEINLLVTGSAVAKKILPFFLQVAPNLVDSIEFKMDDLISRYAD